MSALADRLASDLVAAMRAGDAAKLNVLRLVKAAVMNWELAKEKTASDDDLIALLTTQVKQRRDASALYRAASRPELAEHEEMEITILQTYLPEELSEEELRKRIADAIAASGAASAKDIGKVMGALMPHVKGKADGAIVNRLVMEALAQKAV